MQRKIDRKSDSVGKHTKTTRRRPTDASYTKALKSAGVTQEDLRLLRELAEINAQELTRAHDHIRQSRVLL